MPDKEMFERYGGNITIAFNVFTHNYDLFCRSLILSRHPALYFRHKKRG
jgi:hypothetical protein